jgi:2-polyprenyl-6-methoxyphenol hydroxylase-like FAD-dependent oxidoreductase
MPAFFFGAVPMDLHTLDDNPVYLLPVPQTRIERVLADRAAELGVEVRRGHELTGLSQHADAVTVEVVGPAGRYEISSRYVVGADGAHSTTRKLAGIEFPGAASDDIVLRIAEVAVPEELVDPATGGLNLPGYGYISPMYHRTERGAFAYARLPSRPDMVFTLEWTTDGFDYDTPLTLEEVHDSIYRVMGADLPLRPPEGRGPHRRDRSIGVNTRLVDRYRDGRVLLVGDAAHVHFVIGGPGLNLGLQDAINLGWKLAAVIHGWAPAGLLDTYGTERRPVGERVAMHSQAQLALLAPGAEVTALRELFTELLRDRRTTTHVANMMAGADICYDMGTERTHALIGLWAPDLLLDTGNGPVRPRRPDHHRPATAAGLHRKRLPCTGSRRMARPHRHRHRPHPRHRGHRPAAAPGLLHRLGHRHPTTGPVRARVTAHNAQHLVRRRRAAAAVSARLVTQRHRTAVTTCWRRSGPDLARWRYARPPCRHGDCRSAAPPATRQHARTPTPH